MLRIPREVTVSFLQPLLEAVLKTQGLVLVQTEQNGLLRVIESMKLVRVAVLRVAGEPGVGGAASAGPVVTVVVELAHADAGKAEWLLQAQAQAEGGDIRVQFDVEPPRIGWC